MPKLLVNIVEQDRDAMMDLLRKHRIEIIRQTARVLDEGQGYSVDAIVETDQFENLHALGYRVEIKENIEEVGKARQTFVGKGDRFRDQSPE